MHVKVVVLQIFTRHHQEADRAIQEHLSVILFYRLFERVFLLWLRILVHLLLLPLISWAELMVANGAGWLCTFYMEGIEISDTNWCLAATNLADEVLGLCPE